MNRTFNTELLWTTPKGSQLPYNWVFMFNNRNLDNWTNIRVIWSNHDDIWMIDFDTYKAPLQDWGWVLWKYYRTKTIQIVLSINADSEYSLNDLIDEIKFQTSKTDWKLQIIINWLVRERTATCTSLKFNRQSFNVNRCWNIVLTFSCVNPHSHLETPSNENFIAQTWSFSKVFSYDWRAESFPILRLSIDSWNSEWMSFQLNWYTISISENLNGWDVIVFDWEKKEVRVNDIEVAYTWPFTPLTYWDNHFTITNDWVFSGALSYFIKYL